MNGFQKCLQNHQRQCIISIWKFLFRRNPTKKEQIHVGVIKNRIICNNSIILIPDACNSTGGVCILRWTPDGCAVAMAWEKGGYSIWSPFGALLVCTLATDFR
jgi:hypothetical protein